MKRIKNFTILYFLSILFVSCDSSKVIRIPFYTEAQIQIDGLFNESEWDEAKIIHIDSISSLYLIQNKDYLFLGVKNKDDVRRFIDLYLNNDAVGTINFHASMQLGERHLGNTWNDTIPEWNWGNNTHWTANTIKIVNESEDVSFFESVGHYDGYEFQISKNKIREKQFSVRLEIKDFIGQADDIVFPSNSQRLKIDDWFTLEL